MLLTGEPAESRDGESITYGMEMSDQLTLG